MPSFGAPAVLGYLDEDECDELGEQATHKSTSRIDTDLT